MQPAKAPKASRADRSDFPAFPYFSFRTELLSPDTLRSRQTSRMRLNPIPLFPPSSFRWRFSMKRIIVKVFAIIGGVATLLVIILAVIALGVHG